jgi:hypothetical protein
VPFVGSLRRFEGGISPRRPGGSAGWAAAAGAAMSFGEVTSRRGGVNGGRSARSLRGLAQQATG